MMYICEDCGKVFEEPDIHTEMEYRGEYWGTPAYEHMTYAYCPHCGSEDFTDYYEDEDEEWEDE